MIPEYNGDGFFNNRDHRAHVVEYYCYLIETRQGRVALFWPWLSAGPVADP